eukprot:774616-Amorphochlora_amoeboformis.AAC.1
MIFFKGILDGLGAIRLRKKKVVRVFALHELLNFRGYPYKIKDGKGGFFTLKGARISHFDIDPKTAKVWIASTHLRDMNQHRMRYFCTLYYT